MSVFDQVDFDDHEEVHFIADEPSGLKAIIATHSTALGPAAGGCRLRHYPSCAFRGRVRAAGPRPRR